MFLAGFYISPHQAVMQLTSFPGPGTEHEVVRIRKV
jgi:hypothetical protein